MKLLRTSSPHHLCVGLKASRTLQTQTRESKVGSASAAFSPRASLCSTSLVTPANSGHSLRPSHLVLVRLCPGWHSPPPLGQPELWESYLPEASERLTQAGKSFDVTKSDFAREHRHIVFDITLVWHNTNYCEIP